MNKVLLGISLIIYLAGIILMLPLVLMLGEALFMIFAFVCLAKD